MTLCSLCQSIPFRGLPQLPSAWQHLSLVEEPPPHNELVGFPHQPSLQELAASAVSCELCNFINESVARCVSAYQKAEQDPVFVYYDTSKGFSVDSQLWLTNRLDRGDGFLAFVRARLKESIFLVGCVGFCVEDGTCYTVQSWK
jgi:hypothetical protein